jgi:hypothetical protein
MKLSEYIEKLETILKNHGDVEIIYAVDDEGNYFDKVHFDPSPCRFDENDQEGVEFLSYDETIKVNAVCIN